jgi:hypothetical protein
MRSQPSQQAVQGWQLRSASFLGMKTGSIRAAYGGPEVYLKVSFRRVLGAGAARELGTPRQQEPRLDFGGRGCESARVPGGQWPKPVKAA